MTARAYRSAVVKMTHGERHSAIGGALLNRDECAAVLYALRQLTDAGRKPPRFPVETDAPGVPAVEME